MNQSSLTKGQVLGTMGITAFLWGVGAAKIRYAGPTLYTTNMGKAITFALSLPIGHAAVLATEKVVGSAPRDRLLVASIASAAALVMDGAIYTWYPEFYENEDVKRRDPAKAANIARSGAGYLLYGVGFVLAAAIISS